jgi:hypothetical protein
MYQEWQPYSNFQYNLVVMGEDRDLNTEYISSLLKSETNTAFVDMFDI